MENVNITNRNEKSSKDLIENWKNETVAFFEKNENNCIQFQEIISNDLKKEKYHYHELTIEKSEDGAFEVFAQDNFEDESGKSQIVLGSNQSSKLKDLKEVKDFIDYQFSSKTLKVLDVQENSGTMIIKYAVK